MKVLLFGALADIVGDHVIQIKGMKDTGELLQYLMNEYPALSTRRFQLAVNKEQVTTAIPLNEEDEIALLPPFAGG